MDLEFATASRLRELLASRKISAVELLDQQLRQVGKFNPTYNAIVTINEDEARRQAKKADDALAAGETLGPLHGIPMTIKDAFEVAGMPATCGFEFLRDYRPTHDAAAVARLRRNGAVIFGKTNLPAGAADHQSANSLFGISRNPWNPERTVGGSSGGSAGALAAGMTPLELGSDIGGSIRVPSHFCGVYGHKPSYGIVPGAGHIPPPPGHLAKADLAVVGPLARSAGDLEMLLDILVGPSELDAGAVEIRLPPARREDLRDFRVAVWADAYSLDAGYAAAIEAFVDSLRRLGVAVDSTARPQIDPAQSYEVYLQILFGIIGAGMPPMVRDALFEIGKDKDEGSYENRVARAVRQSHAAYHAQIEAQQQLIRQWRDFFTQYDVLICPITPTVAFPHDLESLELADQFRRRLTVSGVSTPYMDNLAWPGLVTVANLPATAMPTGHFVGGLPAGIQIVGPYLEDRTPLRFARLVESALGGFVVPPALKA
mgnify:CR=1 FL=1